MKVKDQICADGLQTHFFNLLLHVIVTNIHLLPPQHLHGHVHGVGGHVGREAAVQRNLGSIWPVGRKSRSLSYMCYSGSVLKDCVTSSYHLGAVLERLQHHNHKPQTYSALLLSA